MTENEPTTAQAPRRAPCSPPNEHADAETENASAGQESVNPTCLHCGSSLRGRSHKRYCSPSCRVMACRQRKRAVPVLYPAEAGR